MMIKIYTVKPGQSLSIIARDVLKDMNRWKELAFINNIQYPYIIKVGQIIKLPDIPSEPEAIEIKVANAPIAQTAEFFRPATLLLLAVGAFLLFSTRK